MTKSAMPNMHCIPDNPVFKTEPTVSLAHLSKTVARELTQLNYHLLKKETIKKLEYSVKFERT